MNHDSTDVQSAEPSLRQLNYFGPIVKEVS